jgi:hypothetical protein
MATTAPAETPGTTVSRSAIIVSENEEAPPKEPLPKLTVADCIRIAHEKQPKLEALRASLRAAQAGQQGLEGARLLGHLSPDYKFRVRQSAAGVEAAAADLEQATHEVTQAVIWTYYSAVYAAMQVKVASEAVDFVDDKRKIVEKIVNSKEANREFNRITLNKLITRLKEGERPLIEALKGVEKAKAALREAMAVDCHFRFELADDALPDFDDSIQLKKETIIAHATTRRGEVIMANIAAQVTLLEVDVQWVIRLRYRTQTFASGADIHTRPIPQGSRDGDYRPDAVAPEMPTHMFGKREDRTAKARELAARSASVVQKTLNLVTLEAENAYIDFLYAGRTMAAAKEQRDAARKNFNDIVKVGGKTVDTAAKLTDELEAQAQKSLGEAALNEAVYKRIVALASIERITAGGMKIKFPGR